MSRRSSRVSSFIIDAVIALGVGIAAIAALSAVEPPAADTHLRTQPPLEEADTPAANAAKIYQVLTRPPAHLLATAVSGVAGLIASNLPAAAALPAVGAVVAEAPQPRAATCRLVLTSVRSETRTVGNAAPQRFVYCLEVRSLPTLRHDDAHPRRAPRGHHAGAVRLPPTEG